MMSRIWAIGWAPRRRWLAGGPFHSRAECPCLPAPARRPPRGEAGLHEPGSSGSRWGSGSGSRGRFDFDPRRGRPARRPAGDGSAAGGPSRGRPRRVRPAGPPLLPGKRLRRHPLRRQVTFWSRGAEELYGWLSSDAVGQTMREFLRAEYPRPFREIDAEVAALGKWEGTVVHSCRDGRCVAVESRWSLRRLPPGARVRPAHGGRPGPRLPEPGVPDAPRRACAGSRGERGDGRPLRQHPRPPAGGAGPRPLPGAPRGAGRDAHPGTRSGPAGRRGGQPRQERVPLEHVPRTQDADERGPRLRAAERHRSVAPGGPPGAFQEGIRGDPPRDVDRHRVALRGRGRDSGTSTSRWRGPGSNSPRSTGSSSGSPGEPSAGSGRDAARRGSTQGHARRMHAD